MGKMIVFCADGTWNGPEKDQNGDKEPDPTNVYKLFCGLQGPMSLASITDADEQEKELYDAAGAPVQVAKYIHGVGDSKNPIVRLMGGAFGSGMIARIVRGYTYISRNYEAGDGIVIVGFSRGAYTARALAGVIVSQGLLAKHLTGDREKAYRAGAKAWYRYRKKARKGFFQAFFEVLADLPAFVFNDLKDSDFIPVPTISAVGVWDTVGALGLPHYMREPGTDAFKFSDTKLNASVLHGFQAVALDEQRMDFAPCLWEPRKDVIQVVFPGAHADVGGGYPMTNGESGLSDIALGWMQERLETVGVLFQSPLFPKFNPDPLGVAHRPWLTWPFNDPDRCAPRRMPHGVVQGHPSIQYRMGKTICDDPRLPEKTVYAPGNWP